MTRLKKKCHTTSCRPLYTASVGWSSSPSSARHRMDAPGGACGGPGALNTPSPSGPSIHQHPSCLLWYTYEGFTDSPASCANQTPFAPPLRRAQVSATSQPFSTHKSANLLGIDATFSIETFVPATACLVPQKTSREVTAVVFDSAPVR